MDRFLMEYQIERLNLSSMNSEMREIYALLTEPRLRDLLRNISERPAKVIAIGALHQSEPIGLILATLYPNLGHVEILSLYVTRKHRNKKIGTQLFCEVERTCISQGAKVFTFMYRKEERHAIAYEAIFKRQGWASSVPFMEQYLFDAFLFHPPWLKHRPKLPRQYKIFLWKNIKKHEKEKLDHLYEQGHFGSIVYPFFEENIIEPLNSLGIRKKGEIVGWLITHRVSLETLKYSALFIKPDLQFSGYSMRLLIDAINLQRPKEATIRWTLVPVNLREIDSSWYRFVKRRLAPYAQAVIKIYQTWKAV
jgi:GNAT superfamily N-acetyltransferase